MSTSEEEDIEDAFWAAESDAVEEIVATEIKLTNN